MAYSHGHTWTEAEIIERIQEVVNAHSMDTMPSHTELNSYYGNASVSNIVSKRGGSKYFASMLGLKIKVSESKFGESHEDYCSIQIEEVLGIGCQKTKPRYPYDLLVDSSVKVDVKAGNLFYNYGHGAYFTFNLEKKQQTCDIYVCYCIGANKEIVKTLIIPSIVLSGKKQLSLGASSRYDKYIDAWHFISDYAKFMKHTT